MINEVRLIGNLTRDPESPTPNVCKMSVATNKKWKDKEGNLKEKAQFHRVVVFGKQAEFCQKYLTKGRQVRIAGSVEYSTYEKDGQTRYSTDIVADNYGGVTFLGGRGESAGSARNPSGESRGNAPGAASDRFGPGDYTPPGNDELPF